MDDDDDTDADYILGGCDRSRWCVEVWRYSSRSLSSLSSCSISSPTVSRPPSFSAQAQKVGNTDKMKTCLSDRKDTPPTTPDHAGPEVTSLEEWEYQTAAVAGWGERVVAECIGGGVVPCRRVEEAGFGPGI